MNKNATRIILGLILLAAVATTIAQREQFGDGGLLLDVRPAADFTGETDNIGGHMAGARMIRGGMTAWQTNGWPVERSAVRSANV